MPGTANADYRLNLSDRTVAGLSHRPRRPLLRAELAGGVNFSSRTFKVDLNIEAMFTAAEAVIHRWPKLYFIDAGPDHYALRLRDHIAAFSNCDFRLTLAIAVEAQAHFPGPNARAFNDRVR